MWSTGNPKDAASPRWRTDRMRTACRRCFRKANNAGADTGAPGMCCLHQYFKPDSKREPLGNVQDSNAWRQETTRSSPST